MNKILVANRGEIALRVMRSAKEMGIKTVAVFSEADRNAPFVKYADEAVCIGPPPSSQSYLKGDVIIEVSKKLGVDGIHPGYGFLSENADFARKVKEAGITFVGPSAEAMDMMGDKLSAKAAAKKFNVPMVPGSEGAIKDLDEAIKVALETGFPLLIKASAGGGGKGMRLVERVEDVEEQMKLAMSEARSAFGDDAVFIEKFVSGPRHIEIQVLADNHGNTVYLFERECSIQRPAGTPGLVRDEVQGVVVVSKHRREVLKVRLIDRTGECVPTHHNRVPDRLPPGIGGGILEELMDLVFVRPRRRILQRTEGAVRDPETLGMRSCLGAGPHFRGPRAEIGIHATGEVR